MGFYPRKRQSLSWGVRARDRERGTSFVESAMIIPLLLIIAFGAIEIGRALNQYVILVAIAEEGARVASRIKGLGVGTVISSYDLNTNTTATISYSPSNQQMPAGHDSLRDKVAKLIKLNSDTLSVSGLQIETEYISGNVNVALQDSLAVKIDASYLGIFKATNYLFGAFGLDGLPIRTRAIGPYIN